MQSFQKPSFTIVVSRGWEDSPSGISIVKDMEIGAKLIWMYGIRQSPSNSKGPGRLPEDIKVLVMMLHVVVVGM